MRNPDDNRTIDNLEKLLAEAKAIEDRKQALIAELLKQKEAAIKDFDDKLAKLGYQGNSGRLKRSHHKESGTARESEGSEIAVTCRREAAGCQLSRRSTSVPVP